MLFGRSKKSFLEHGPHRTTIMSIPYGGVIQKWLPDASAHRLIEYPARGQLDCVSHPDRLAA